MRDIARQSGFSIFTVSLALRRDPRIKLETRRKIQAAAAELGYQRDPYIAALMSQFRSQRPEHIQAELGLLLLDRLERVAAYSHVMALLEQIRQRASVLGYRIELFDPYGKGPDFTRIRKVLKARNIRGLILTSSAVATAAEDLQQLDWQHVAAVMLGISVPYPPVHRVDTDSIQSIRLAWDRARQADCRRIGFAVPRAIEEYVQHQYRMAIDYCNRQVPAPQRVPVYEEAKWDQAAFRRWLRMARPDVIVSTDEHLLVEIRAAGYRVPEDLGFIGLSLTNRNPDISGVLVPLEQTARSLVDTVNQQIVHNEPGLPACPRRIVLQPEWNAGASLRSGNR